MQIVDVKVPAGTYWLGDPGYVIKGDGTWVEWLTHSSVGVVDGVVGSSSLRAVAFSSSLGDGVYDVVDSSDGAVVDDVAVDSGLVGLVPVELFDVADDVEGPWSMKVTFFDEVVCSSVDGVLHFGPLHVDTRKWSA